MGVVALGAEELEGEVEPFDLTGPALGLGAGSAGDEVGFEVVESADHLRADVEHGTPDASVPDRRTTHRNYGTFTQVPDDGQLAGYFLLDRDARRRAMACRGARSQLGYAVQLGTVRFLGTFLYNREHALAEGVAYVADQLGHSPSVPSGRCQYGPGLGGFTRAAWNAAEATGTMKGPMPTDLEGIRGGRCTARGSAEGDHG
ncbi:DUF4158 domain-containing protein [Streptomyces sp. PRh5]|uniref:DUF4158 domain-containing protein n=1 Tax=Streptomyces sp. PRh5 TaxID=1158056 RepID=UPI0012FF5A2B|nr:DUF4158 domain-containing protein [Streptomyces sp. PRh5]